MDISFRPLLSVHAITAIWTSVPRLLRAHDDVMVASALPKLWLIFGFTFVSQGIVPVSTVVFTALTPRHYQHANGHALGTSLSCAGKATVILWGKFGTVEQIYNDLKTISYSNCVLNNLPFCHFVFFYHSIQFM